jgi:hypothetical protein
MKQRALYGTLIAALSTSHAEQPPSDDAALPTSDSAALYRAVVTALPSSDRAMAASSASSAARCRRATIPASSMA